MRRETQGAAMAPSRLRLGPARAPTLFGVLAAGVLIAALVITGRSQHLAPDRQAVRPAAVPAADTTPVSLGAIWACPLLAPVPAFADHRSYPPGHPAAPPSGTRPAACYPTTARAAAAGYPPAPPPAGTLEVGGVYLTPTGRWFQHRCQQAADRFGFAVPCPALLPAMSPQAVPPAPCDQQFPCLRGGAFVVDQDGFVVPPEYVGAAGQAKGRLVVAAASRADDPAVACEEPQRLVGTVTPHRMAGRLIECSGAGLHHDTMLVRWRERDTVMAVSVLGQAPLQQRLALTVAEQTLVVPPSGELGGDRPHGLVTPGGDVADVDGQDPARMAQDDLAVDLGVALVFLSYEHH